jgi:two-component system sensor histidine kinase YesM
MLFIIYTIAKSISKPIVLLSHKMKDVKKRKLEKLEIKEQKDEIGNLVTSYNYMVDEIQSLLLQQFELGQEKKGAELMALQSQINPHFLYNTLDMINWMAKKNEEENIRDTVEALSKYYRLILNKGEDIITIRDELELCKAYITIQQKRFKQRIQFEIDVEDSILMYLIPKITLQPLLENAIIHGISESPSGTGTIIISGWEEDDKLILAVTDDGVGMDSVEGIENKHKGSHYGISNIEMRLTLFYGMKQCISYESTKGVGTCVSLNIRKVK